MPNADLTRREKPCPTCNGAGGHFKALSVHYEEWIICPTCHGQKIIPAETPDEYAARLRELVEQARAEVEERAEKNRQLSKKATRDKNYKEMQGKVIELRNACVRKDREIRDLKKLVEQARRERDWLVKHPACIPHRCEHQVACKTDQFRRAILDVYTPIVTPEQCEQARLEMAARAVAGKDGE